MQLKVLELDCHNRLEKLIISLCLFNRNSHKPPFCKFNSLVLQLAFNGFCSGPNGIGGITLKGYPTKISLKTDKQGIITYTMNVFGNGLNADITIWIGYGDNHAEATVNATFSNGQVRFSGRLVPLVDSNYYRSGFDF